MLCSWFQNYRLNCYLQFESGVKSQCVAVKSFQSLLIYDNSSFVFFFFHAIYLLKKQGHLTHRISSILNFADCTLIASFNHFLCPLSWKPVVGSRVLLDSSSVPLMWCLLPSTPEQAVPFLGIPLRSVGSGAASLTHSLIIWLLKISVSPSKKLMFSSLCKWS